MAMSRERTELYAGEQPQVFDAACRTAGTLKLTVTAANPAYGQATLSAGMSLFSWGEDLHLQVFQAGAGVVAVTLRSGLKFGLVDWGRNRRNLEKYFSALSTALPPAPAAWLLDPTRRHQLRWWDGQAWTANVSDGGQQGTDPIG